MKFLYLLRCEQYVKIGIANDLRHRLLYVATNNPFPVLVLNSFEFPNARNIERDLHRAYRAKRHKLEWFLLSDADLAAIESFCLTRGGLKLPPFDLDRPRGKRRFYNRIRSLHPPVPLAIDAPIQRLWRIEITNGGTHWIWRKGSGDSRESFAGGRLEMASSN